MSDAPVRFSRVLIEGLFDADAPPIDIRFDLEHRVTILHGRNGSGKTITLSLLDALRRGDLQALVEAPFERLVIEVTDGSYVEFDRPAHGNDSTEGDVDPATSRGLRYDVVWGEGYTDPAVRGLIDPASTPASDSVIRPQFVQNHGLLRGDLVRSTNIRKLQDVDLFGVLAATTADTSGAADEFLIDFCERCPPIKFVSADRLLAPPSRPVPTTAPGRVLHIRPPQRELMVERLSQDIREHVQAADKKYRLTATQLDNALRQRLIDPTTKTDASLDELRRRYAALADEEARLRDLGLFQEASPPVRPESFTEKNRTVLAILLEDNEQKLEPFRKLADRAQRLLTTLNRKLAPKSVKLNVETGYHVAAADGRPLPLDKLSSGEQHELVLLHELLFEAAPGSLILIDEPELSLHPTWQAEFLPDVLAIAELSDLDFVLATHSPYIIGDRSDLMVRLGAPVDERT